MSGKLDDSIVVLWVGFGEPTCGSEVKRSKEFNDIGVALSVSFSVCSPTEFAFNRRIVRTASSVMPMMSELLCGGLSLSFAITVCVFCTADTLANVPVSFLVT